MRTVLIAALASVSSLVLATEALAQTVNTQATIAIPNANVNAGAPPGQQQTQITLPSAFLFATRRAGIGPGGFTQLCDDPLDPRAFTNECSAAGIGQ
jgi:hypothetical protein